MIDVYRNEGVIENKKWEHTQEAGEFYYKTKFIRSFECYISLGKRT